ncbi:hypothetical protein F511_06802 [Dorcoceras hygrometricum]|uniref:Uncharacterized protein n=1 Tax=Dorcoceras hygrometricum TaxID=472368 RepID=A0A2Z7CL23_9LAMI|nr:hypothetical protein F511_06802 [Dorcoceras hygrometricum]
MKRRRVEESADGLELMTSSVTSSVTSSYSADGLREQSQESAAIAKRCRLHKLIRQRFAIQQMLFALITSRELQWSQTQATAHPVESLYESVVAIYPVASFAYPVDLVPRRKKIRSRRSVETQPVASYSIQSQRSRRKKRRSSEALHSVARFQSQYLKISAEDEFSRSDKSAAKQLTIYESWMSTAELNSNGEKRQDAINAQDGKNKWLK